MFLFAAALQLICVRFVNDTVFRDVLVVWWTRAWHAGGDRRICQEQGRKVSRVREDRRKWYGFGVGYPITVTAGIGLRQDCFCLCLVPEYCLLVPSPDFREKREASVRGVDMCPSANALLRKTHVVSGVRVGGCRGNIAQVTNTRLRSLYV